MPELDGLRFVAIASVFLYHLAGDVLRHSPAGTAFNSLLFHITQQLHIGVPLFFAISGTILSLPFAKHSLSGTPPVMLKAYFLRRLTRLEPPYIVSLLLFFILKLVADKGSVEQLLPHLTASMFYVHNLLFSAPSTINIVSWSLEVEIQFYVVVPLLVTVFSIHRASLRRSVLVTAILLFSYVNVTYHYDSFVHLTLFGNLHYFLIGFLLSDLHLTGVLDIDEGRWWDIVTVFGWPLLVLGLVYGGLVFRLVLPFLILLIYCAVFKGRRTRRAFGRSLVAGAGGMCYSIYLTHNYVIAATGLIVGGILIQADFATRLAVQTLLHAGPVLIASIVFYKLIEQPCMDPEWPVRLLGSERTSRIRS